MRPKVSVLMAVAAGLLSNELAEAGTAPVLTVIVCNSAPVPEPTLSLALSIDQRIFEQTGIETAWLPQNTGKKACFTVTLVPGHPESPVPRDALGVVWWTRNADPPTWADIFFGNILERATTRKESATLLANVIAHEIGHLLLGPQHAATGLMSAQWDGHATQTALRLPLRIERAEGARVRQAAERICAVTPPPRVRLPGQPSLTPGTTEGNE